MTEEKQKIPEGIWIAALPAAGYWFAFLFQVGYFSHFYIPTSFIHVGIPEVLIATSVLFATFVYGNFIVSMLTDPFRFLPAEIRKSLIHACLWIFIIFVISFKATLTTLQSTLVTLGGGAIVLIITFVFPLLAHKDKSGYLNKLAAVNSDDENSPALVKSVLGSLAPKIGLIVATALVFSLFFWGAGNLRAMFKMKYIVIAEPVEMVVISSNNDFYITASYDRANEVLLNDYALVPKNLSASHFTLENLGPFKAPREKPDADD